MAEHADQSDQPPLMAHGVFHVAAIVNFVTSRIPLTMGLAWAVVTTNKGDEETTIAPPVGSRSNCWRVLVDGYWHDHS